MVRANSGDDEEERNNNDDAVDVEGIDPTEIDPTVLPNNGEDEPDLFSPSGPECPKCGAAFDSDRGMRSHVGQVHSDVELNDDGEIVTEDDGDDEGAETDGGTILGENQEFEPPTIPGDDGDALSERADARDRANRTVQDLWEDAREAFELASVSATDVTRRDARGVGIDALTAETDYLSVRRRSDESHEDLWRWTEENGWEDDGFEFVNSRMRAELGTDADTTAVRETVKHIASQNKIGEEELNAGEFDETLVPVANGVISIDGIGYDADSMTIDWSDVELRDMRKEYNFTYRFDAKWDPENADVEGLEEWLERVTVSDADRRVIWEFAGHALHDRYPVDGFLELLGDGGSGKSQVLEVIKAMLGDEHTTPVSISDMEVDRFVGVHVADARANINTELSGTKLPSIDKLKTMTAGEEMWVQKKGIDGYFTRNDATMMFSSDDPPAFPTRNDALGRRLYPVEFPYQFVDNPDPSNPFELQSRPKLEVQDELQADDRLSAALMLSVEGLVRLLKEGNFTDGRTRKERIEAHEAYADPILDFKRVCIEDAGPDSQIESGVLKATFNAFAEAKDHDGKTLQQITDILGGTVGISFSKGRTRNWSDEQSKHTVYSGIRFSAEALRNFVPSHAMEDGKLDLSAAHDAEDNSEPTAIDDHDTDDDDSDSETNVEDAIKSAVNEMNDDDAPSVEAVKDRVVTEHKVSMDNVEHAAENLLSRGELYEPATGRWRCT